MRLAAALAIAALPAAAEPTPLGCSAHFQARAEWMRTMGADAAAVRHMESYADLLLIVAEANVGPDDCGILDPYGDRAPCGPPSLAFQRDQMSVTVMTDFAQDGWGSGPLPLCMEESACVDCTTLLGSLLR